ncbi:hypothetical protein B2G49_01355 [Halomonas sp. 'Soap Lake |nr:hypothetical protein B2G49_01355 [Halomonas sp. 'Soap Lake \
MALSLPAVSYASGPPSSIALSWTIAETLVALGIPPQGMLSPSKYEEWGSIRSLPESIFDIGLSAQPNLELITQLDPNIIISDGDLSRIDERLSRSYNTLSFSIYDSTLDTWNELTEFTKELSISIDQPNTAEDYINTIEAEIENLKYIIKDYKEPFLVIRALDKNHIRVYGENSLPQAVLDRLDLLNAWDRPTTQWGFTVVGVEELIGIDARLVIVESGGLHDDIMNQLSNYGLWQHIPSIKEGTVITVPPFWIFGALPSAYQFANSLVTALAQE